MTEQEAYALMDKLINGDTYPEPRQIYVEDAMGVVHTVIAKHLGKNKQTDMLLLLVNKQIAERMRAL